MTTFEIVVAVLLLVMLGAVGGAVVQVRAIAREVRTEGRETRAHLSGEVATLLDMERAELQALRESMQGRASEAVETIKQAEALTQEHRHIWRYSSGPELTNGERIMLYRCEVCREITKHYAGDPLPGEAGSG